MKNKLKIIGFVFSGILFSQALNAQNKSDTKTVAPSDVSSGYTYDYNKVFELIIERIKEPKDSNTDVQIFLNQSDFPKLAHGKVIDPEYKEQLRKWMEKNSALIITTLKPRKDIITQY